MKTLILKNIVQDSSSNEQGVVLFQYLKNAFLNEEVLILEIDSELTLSSSFLNTSIGEFLDSYGLDSFRRTVKFKGAKNQFTKLSKYIKSYTELYLI